MSEARRVLYLVVDGLAPERVEELRKSAGPGAEIMTLTEANAAEALQKIFAADTVAVWGEI